MECSPLPLARQPIASVYSESHRTVRRLFDVHINHVPVRLMSLETPAWGTTCSYNRALHNKLDEELSGKPHESAVMDVGRTEKISHVPRGPLKWQLDMTFYHMVIIEDYD